MFTNLQNVIDSGDCNYESICNELNRIYDEAGDVADRRMAAFLLFLNWEHNTCPVAPEDIDVSTYDDCEMSYGSADYLVLDKDEAEERWNQSLEDYIDELILPEIPETYRNYFDVEAWKRDARLDGRGHALASYDSEENYSRGYFIYRIN